MKSRRLAVSAVAVTGLALSLTGCLGSAGDKAGEAGKNLKLTAAEILGRTAERAGKTDTYTMKIDVDGQGGVSMKMSAAVRIRPSVAMHITTEPTSVQGTSVPGFEAILDAQAMYLKMPALAATNGGKPWSKIALSDLSATSGLNLSGLMDQARQQSPAEQTKMLTASRDVREVGTETVDGVPARHFAGTVPVTAALGKLDAQTRAKLEQQYQKLGVSTLTFDLWVGSDDLPRKMVSRLSTSSGPMTTTASYSGYGKPVDVTPPPASEVGAVKLPGAPRA
ncbi:hypothetical protein BTM25_40670 [Actinomadura rubteroloni]|uniref:LppX_LprAFG lipoprotein n=1 Tax=Actinomadura rubteroloni TaxID=1926885 RepID=A0A2P4UK43_9ACTN|nr:hypothetical protein [Actinomadura rubteroloni]POM25423.1 hypothetical protein BTM25_40670 [Actinomadura rubteroloni]